jgi:hypothetical protein
MARREHRRASQINPRSGYYILSLVPKGWGVPVHVTIENDVIQITVNGSQAVDVWSVSKVDDMLAEATIDGTLFDHPLFRIVLFGEPCDETTYRHRLAMREWAAAEAPWHPCLHPEQPMDPRTLPATDF